MMFKTVAEGMVFGAAYEVNKSNFFAHVFHAENEQSVRGEA